MAVPGSALEGLGQGLQRSGVDLMNFLRFRAQEMRILQKQQDDAQRAQLKRVSDLIGLKQRADQFEFTKLKRTEDVAFRERGFELSQEREARIAETALQADIDRDTREARLAEEGTARLELAQQKEARLARGKPFPVGRSAKKLATELSKIKPVDPEKALEQQAFARAAGIDFTPRDPRADTAAVINRHLLGITDEASPAEVQDVLRRVGVEGFQTRQEAREGLQGPTARPGEALPRVGPAVEKWGKAKYTNWDELTPEQKRRLFDNRILLESTAGGR